MCPRGVDEVRVKRYRGTRRDGGDLRYHQIKIQGKEAVGREHVCIGGVAHEQRLGGWVGPRPVDVLEVELLLGRRIADGVARQRGWSEKLNGWRRPRVLLPYRRRLRRQPLLAGRNVGRWWRADGFGDWSRRALSAGE